MLADFFLCVWCRVRCGSIVLGCFSSLNQQKGKTFSFSSQDTDTSDIFSFSIFKREEIESERSLGNMSVSLTTTVAFFSCMKISIGGSISGWGCQGARERPRRAPCSGAFILYLFLPEHGNAGRSRGFKVCASSLRGGETGRKG